MSEPIGGTKLQKRQKIETKSRHDTAWKSIFNTCFYNETPDDKIAGMWTQFKKDNLQREDINDTFKQSDFSDEEREAFDRVYTKTNTVEDLIKEMKKETKLQDNVWKMLFIKLRDKAVEPIDHTKTIRVVEGGEEKEMNLDDIEEKFKDDYPDLETSQLSIPEELIHKDYLDLEINNQTISKKLKDSYTKKYDQISKSLKEDSLNMKEEERQKRAENQALDDIKKSQDHQLLDSRQALYAENLVQQAIKKAAEKFGIPMTILCGVKTFHDIGKPLADLGITLSPLKSFKSAGYKGSQEVETDLTAVALTATGPVISCVEVG